MRTDKLLGYLNSRLKIDEFSDYCPNGLQIQGRDTVESLLCATTANAEVCGYAAKEGFDAILCHHGLYWKNESPCLIGLRYARVKPLIDAEVNLLAYHLPLDVHSKWGNNVALAEKLGWVREKSHTAAGVPELLCEGRLERKTTVAQLIEHVSNRLERPALAVGLEGKHDRIIERVAWCTGAADDFFEQAIALGVDCYLSGEISLNTTDLARESGVLYIGAGHHATERFGVIKLGRHIENQYKIQVDYYAQDNPV